MDEYLLADSFLSFEPIAKEILTGNYEKIPLASLTGMGGGMSALVQQLKNSEGIYRAYNPKTGEILKQLPYKSKQMAGAYVGSLVQANGKYDQAAFIKVSGIAAVDPMLLAAVITLTIVLQKIGDIEQSQKNILQFLQADKRTQLEGSYTYLVEVYQKLKHNLENGTFTQTAHIKVQDIIQKSEENIKFYSEQVEALLEKKRFFNSNTEVRNNIKNTIALLSCYRLAVHLYAFSSFLEVLLINNYSKAFLNELTNAIREHSYSYNVLYSKCYTKFSEKVSASIETGLMSGVAKTAKTAGNLINKIPIIERGPVDEALLAAGTKLEEHKDSSIDSMLNGLVTLSNTSTAQFINAIDSIDELHNSEIEILADNKNLYIKMSA